MPSLIELEEQTFFVSQENLSLASMWVTATRLWSDGAIIKD
jgi:hypothetical protein